MAEVANALKPTKRNHILRDFQGVNTQANRENIGDDEFAWLENVMPVGPGNMPALNGATDVGIVLTGEACYYMADANIAGTDYMFMFCQSGAAYQVNLTSYVVTKFAGSGKAYTFGASGTRMTQWKNDRILIIDSTGYFDWDTATLTSRGGTTSAPSTGTTIAVFAGHVWIGNNRTIVFSVEDSFTDFSTGASGGGSFIMSDSTLHSSIKQLCATNGFLYIIGQDSVNVVSDVRFSTVTNTTIFSNLNLVTTAGTTSPDSVIPYYRTLWLATQYGFYGITGSTAQKGSDALDGVIPSILTTLPISGGVAVINNILCLCFLFRYNDPSVGARPLFAIFFNKKWFFASQGSQASPNYLFAASASLSGTAALFATDGTKLYKLFSNTSATLTQTIQTRLWDMGDPILYKQAFKLGLELVSPGGTPVVVTATIDTELNNSPPVTVSASNTVQWINNAMQIVTWTNNSSQTVTWGASGYALYKNDVSNVGKYVGVSLSCAVAGMTYAGVQLQYEMRGAW